MSQKSDCQVLPEGEAWALKQAGGERILSRHERQEEAIEAGRREVHTRGGGELLVHGRNGQIRDKITVAPGSDPFPPRG